MIMKGKDSGNVLDMAETDNSLCMCGLSFHYLTLYKLFVMTVVVLVTLLLLVVRFEYLLTISIRLPTTCR